jgi:hypothetical protein
VVINGVPQPARIRFPRDVGPDFDTNKYI